MRTHRIFTPEPLEVGRHATLGEKPAHYLSRVLRLPEGSVVVLFNGDGHDYHSRIAEFGRNAVRVEVLDRRTNTLQSPLRVTLCQALSRGERMDYSLQKATELGVAAVQLLNTERVELRLEGPRLEKRLAHWRRVMESASEQSGRATVPELRAPIDLEAWLARPGPKLVLDSKGGVSLRAANPSGEVDIAVGPEGGFSDEELASMKAKGVTVARLGPRILRTETAGPAAIAVLQSTAGDLA